MLVVVAHQRQDEIPLGLLNCRADGYGVCNQKFIAPFNLSFIEFAASILLKCAPPRSALAPLMERRARRHTDSGHLHKFVLSRIKQRHVFKWNNYREALVKGRASCKGAISSNNCSLHSMTIQSIDMRCNSCYYHA